MVHLWRLIGILTITTALFFVVLTAVATTPTDLLFFIAAWTALVAPPGLMLASLHAGRRRLAAYCSIPGALLSAGAGCFVLFGFLVPPAGIVQVLLYPVGLALALPYGYASLLQVRIAATICLGRSKEQAALRAGEDGLLLPS